ncbi:phosphonate metabolism protein PhnM [Paenibacillus sp. N1-5-1-14]|uniref:phosphonate metabolism protein PhnM n=1 Tax=Paenibacillus radicibacter TaxID=2972488 RepID=UPI0021592B78|nr:phosphonate metabolism protein PhnM [Paenibacillus radicibacter]MCR8641161.1 phosphonate metabolism protein PhnM [Paenibacillus radicibacter]
MSQSGKRIIITNAKIVTPTQVVEGTLWVEDGVIKKIEQQCENEWNHDELLRSGSDDNSVGSWDADASVIDAEGMIIMPGMIETHSDAIEREISPRPNSVFPLVMAMRELEKKMAAVGITTLYHSICSSDGTPVRNDEIVASIIDYAAAKRHEASMIRHRIHLRYEITNTSGLDMVERMLHEGKIDLLSLMDHTPGQGQYRDVEVYRHYLMKSEHLTVEETDQIFAQLATFKEKVDWDHIRKVVQLAQSKGIQVASHDDDTEAKIDFIHALGIGISEFPVTLEAAHYAKQRDMYVTVGAPNVVRGGSHNKNLSAMEAIQEGCVDILCSDYHPPSLLPSVFMIHQSGMSLPEAMRMVTLHPAAALGIESQVGSIEVGKVADLLFVQEEQGYPLVRRTMIAGTFVYQSSYLEGIGEPAHDRLALSY